MEIFRVLGLCRGPRIVFSAPRLELIIITLNGGAYIFAKSVHGPRAARGGMLSFGIVGGAGVTEDAKHCRGCGGFAERMRCGA